MLAECCCGKLSVEISGKPMQHGICHCNDCKKRTGSAFGVSVYFKREAVVQIKGKASCYVLRERDDGTDQERYFCKKCGTTVYWYVSMLPGLVGIAGGCFVDSILKKPEYSSSTKSKAAWVKLPWGVKEYT